MFHNYLASTFILDMLVNQIMIINSYMLVCACLVSLPAFAVSLTCETGFSVTTNGLFSLSNLTTVTCPDNTYSCFRADATFEVVILNTLVSG